MKFVLFAIQWILVGLGAAVLLLAGRALLDGGLAALPGSPFGTSAASGYAAAVTRAAPAVVSVHAVSRTAAAHNRLTDDPLFREFFGNTDAGTATRQETSLGSGVILDASGIVLTNYHVVRGAQAIRVSLRDGRSHLGHIVGTDPDTDLAVLRIDLQGLPSIALGDSDALRVGDVVLAIGNPLGIGQTVTQGIVSATGRNRVGINTFENFIQTDAAINFGNSGGALVNSRGELVGINSVRVDSEGIGFAIPTSIAIDVARQILATGGVARGWLGIDARDLTASLREMLGVDSGILVLGVLPGGPADRAGLRTGDVITALGAQPIADSRMAIEHIAAFAPGTRIALEAVREGTAFSTEVTVSRRPVPRG